MEKHINRHIEHIVDNTIPSVLLAVSSSSSSMVVPITTYKPLTRQSTPSHSYSLMKQVFPFENHAFIKFSKVFFPFVRSFVLSIVFCVPRFYFICVGFILSFTVCDAMRTTWNEYLLIRLCGDKTRMVMIFRWPHMLYGVRLSDRLHY